MEILGLASKDDEKYIALALSGLASKSSQHGERDESRAFNCYNCGERYVPFKAEFVPKSTALCDACFLQFDIQKMNGRMRDIFGYPSQNDEFYTESIDEWIKHIRALNP